MSGNGTSLRSIAWHRTYKSIHGRLVKEFLIPALQNSILYRRVAGYFSSSVLTVAAAGIAKLLYNGGEMELIIGADLSENDVQALNNGYLSIHDYVKEKIPTSLEGLDELTQFIMSERYNALSWLISIGKLKIKIAIVIDENGQIKVNQESPLFHDKWGIFYDQNGDFIGFMGSANESRQGWLKNHEKIHVYRGWIKEEEEFLRDDLNDFDSYWNDEEHGIRVYDVSGAINENLIRYRTKKPPFKEPFERSEVNSKYDSSPEIPTQGLPGKIIGIYNRLEFMDPDQFSCVMRAHLLNALPEIDHSWNALLQTISFEPFEHQIYVAHEIFNHFPRGYLLCDEVGLGKTIEAGLAIKWLKLAGKVKRVLIIVPKNIIKQWQEELREKFNLEFYIYDGKDLITPWGEHFIPARSNPYNSADLILVSSGLVIRNDRMRVLLESNLWDLIVFDEAHHLRRKYSQSRSGIGSAGKLLQLAEQIKLKTRCCLLMTATPIQIRIGELFDLLRLLGFGGKWGIRGHFRGYYDILSRPAEIRSYWEWEYLVEMAKDFLQWGRLNHELYKDELDHIDERPNYDFEFRRIFLKGDDFSGYFKSNQKNPIFLQELSNELETISPLRWYMFRNTRSQLQDYGIHVAERKPRDVSIEMTSYERKLYKEVEKYITDIYKKAEEDQKSAIGFTLATYRRRLTSSFIAIRETLKRRKELLEKEKLKELKEFEIPIPPLFSDEDIDEDLVAEYDIDLKSDGIEPEEISYSIFQEESDIQKRKKKKTSLILAKSTFEEEIEYLETFTSQISDFLSKEYESKFLKLKELLYKANKEDAKRVLVFTQYTDTLDYLKGILQINPDFQELGAYSGSGGELLKYDSDIKSYIWEKCSKEQIKTWFFEEGSFKIMLCTDAASEGLNFQVCNWMINYDLPWNPMRVEQRIGRIDRVKQEADELYIYNLLYTQTIEGRIYKRLWDRIRLFQNAIGPLEPILNVYQKAEKFAISEGDDQLTEDEIEKMLGDIQEETKRAEDRHDFFLKLLQQRVRTDFEQSRTIQAFVPKNFYSDWFKEYLNFASQGNFKFHPVISCEDHSDYISAAFNGPSSYNLFIPKGAKVLQKNAVKSQTRNLLDQNLLCNIANILEYDKIESSYYFAPHTTLFENMVQSLTRANPNAISAIFSQKFENNHQIYSAKIIVKIQFSTYPRKFQSVFGIYTLDFTQNKIIKIKLIGSIDKFEDLLKDISNSFDDLNPLKDQLKTIQPILLDMKNLIQELPVDHLLSLNDNQLVCKDNTNPMNWEEIKHDFEALKETYRKQFARKIQQWLILEYFNDYPPQLWEEIPDEIKLPKYLDDFYSHEQGERFKRIIAQFNLEDEFERIDKNNALIKGLFNIYKNKRKYKLLKADQERTRREIFEVIKLWSAEKEVFKSKEFEFIKLTKIFRPKYQIIGMILKNG